ncbi:hypothetical protein AFE_3056 [Acidithiobacillus ferrooxidans ATCC 23270]|uniref:Uncharacterized protein n=1 Tax=Acidithiobacillus ferrooxidans (strain ATCC 23270 / DSM 14882 / CIP 104768 / NCIMB 8455) TaxID=243159 RepID=B7JA29_ACIF2|nr:hypothetical protein AFE_3056 [Acidithiobacillus ferrooxidans ATCC 23270]
MKESRYPPSAVSISRRPEASKEKFLSLNEGIFFMAPLPQGGNAGHPAEQYRALAADHRFQRASFRRQ